MERYIDIFKHSRWKKSDHVLTDGTVSIQVRFRSRALRICDKYCIRICDNYVYSITRFPSVVEQGISQREKTLHVSSLIG